MPKSSTQFLRNIDYAPSNPQVLAQHIQAQNSKSLPALIALNSQNDQAATANRHGLLQQGQQPTIAEREITEAMPQVAGIPAGGMPNAGGISPMAANGVGALGGPLPQPIGSGVGQLPAPPIDPRVMAAGGGLISLAEGGLPEDYVPYSEQNMLQRIGGFLGDDDTWSWDEGGLGHYALEEAKDPTNLLLLGGGIGLGAQKIYQGGKTLRRMLKAKYPHLERKALDKLQDLYSKKTPGFFLGKNPRTFSPGRAIVSGTLAAKGAEAGIGALMGDDAPEGQTPEELYGKRTPFSPVPIGTKGQGQRSGRVPLEVLTGATSKAGKDPKADKVTPATKKGGLASLFGGLSPSAAQAMIVGGLKYAETGKAGEAAKEGITTGLAVKSQDLAQKKLKADEDYREKSLKLEKDKMNLVYKAAVKNAGITHNELLKAENTFNDKRMDGFKTEARAELETLAKRIFWDKEVTETQVIDLAKKKAKEAFRTSVIDTLSMSRSTGMLGDVNDVLGARGVQ